MKTYAIFDESINRNNALGYLFCYEKGESYIIELCKDLDQWQAPLLFQNLIKKKIYTVPKDIALLWVRERVIPSGRQNIGAILKNAKLWEYNELALLHLSKGRCAQDACYLVEVTHQEIEEEIRLRRLCTITECFLGNEQQLICLFRDNTVYSIALKKIARHNKEILRVMQNPALLHTVKVGVGGYSISFHDSIEIMASDIRKKGELIPLRAEVFWHFAKNNLVDTTRACELLQCSRQNLAYLVKSKKLVPVIKGAKESLYTKGSLEELRNL